MGMLERLFDNPSIRKAAFGKIRDAMKTTGYSFGTFRLDENDEVQIDFCKEDMSVIASHELNELNRGYKAWIMGEPFGLDNYKEKGVQDGK